MIDQPPSAQNSITQNERKILILCPFSSIFSLIVAVVCIALKPTSGRLLKGVGVYFLAINAALQQTWGKRRKQR